MPIRLQIFLIIGTVVSFFVIFNLIKKERLQLKYSLLWVFIGIVMVILSLFPNIINYISYFLGIETPTNTLFLMGLIFELMILFSLTIALSKNSERVKNLTQEIALLRKEMKEEIKNK